MATLHTPVIDEEHPLRDGELDGLTLDQFLALPDVKPALEYEEGRVTQKESPQGQHSRLQSALVTLFDRAGSPKIALAFPELRTTYTAERHSYVPDVAVYLWARIPRTPDGDVANVFTEPPDIAVEIVSPEQTVAEQTAKCVWYVGHGVRIALVVNPADRSVRLVRPGQAPTVLRGDDQLDFGDILPGFRITVRELFATLRLD